MGAVDTILTAARYKIADTLKKNYKDDELLSFANEGNRMLRRSIAILAPDLIITKETKDTVANQDFVSTAKTILHIPDGYVRINKERLLLVRPDDIGDLSETGLPRCFWQEGFNKIALWPVPDGAYSADIRYVETASVLAAGGSTPWPDEYDDIIQEYIVIRAGTRDEATMDVEQVFLKWFIDQVTPLVCLSTPAGGAKSKW